MRDVTVRRLEEVVGELQSQLYEKKRLEEVKSRLEDKVFIVVASFLDIVS